MKYKNFLLRAVNLLLILGVLWQYQQVALVRAAAVSQRKQEIAEVEAYNASVLQAQSAAQAEQTQSGYRDGTYEGSAFGFGDVIRVQLLMHVEILFMPLFMIPLIMWYWSLNTLIWIY